jgi:membrane associated rhomboid family serine protease
VAEQLGLPAWISEMRSGDVRQMDYLGSYAIRDLGFLSAIEAGFGVGDLIALEALRAHLKVFHEKLTSQPLHRFGLSSERTNSLAWLTYQFSHVGFLHLLSNMVFLFLIGLVVESAVGALGLLCLYLGGGVAGALLFLWLSPGSVIPMVGASGAVSALMAFYALFEPRKNIRYYYIIAPFQNLHGYIYLPTLLILPLFLVSDITGLISAPEGLVSGVAYGAHVGGAIFGFFWAVILRFALRVKPASMI